MPPKKLPAALPPIAWDANNHALVWQLIMEITKPQNLKVLCGKLTKHENTSGETKASVFRRIGSVLLPELHAVDATATGDRVKGKYEWALVPIQRMFPFFPDLHRIWATKPNKNPIAVTTGVGPSGKRTLIMQPLTSSGANNEAVVQGSDEFEFTNSQLQEMRTLQDVLNMAQQSTVEKENIPTLPPSKPQSDPSTPLRTAPRSSMMSQDSISKAKERIQKVAKKRTIEDTLMDIHKSNTDAINTRTREELIVKKRQLLLEEFKAGVWDREEYQEELRKLEDGEPPKKQTRQYSPDWDLD
ncbi:hypothetical protein BU15DRAFT_55018 [Melanogaster broomeanus]|nr:hypothetical protein BU15DRAFT_55018 [Melanogaster broomeanus]